MKKENLFINNRKGQKISVLVEEPKDSIGLVIIMHGLGGFKEQSHIETISKTFLNNNVSSLRFDAVHTFGMSVGGKYEDATITNYYEDLEDVIKWVKNQDFYFEPFFLAGHSLGGISTALYAENNPEEIKGLAPISTVVSGKLSIEKNPKKYEEWKKTGWDIRESSSKPGLIKKLKWSHMEDRLKYDLLENVDKLKMPVLLIVGENDESTPYKHQKMLFEKLNCEKELHLIKNAEHTFKEKNHLEEISEIFDKWIKKFLN